MNNKKKSKTWVWMLILLIIAGSGGGYFYWQKKQSPVEKPFDEVTVQRGNLVLTVLASGKIQPKNRLEIKPPIPGRVETILIEEGQIVKKGEILAWMSSTERAALLDAARAKGEAELKKWEGLYRPTPVMAPIDGEIILKNVETGQTFTNNDPIFVMSDRLTVKAQVDETDLSQIELNQTAEVRLDAYPNQNIPARVEKIAFEAAIVNNVTTYAVDVAPLEFPPYMRAGMTANIQFMIQKKEQVLLIGNEAIRQDGEGSYVLLSSIDPKQEPERRVLTLGISDGRNTEIIQGLNEGDRVLVSRLATGNSANRGSNPFSPMGGGSRRSTGSAGRTR